jgi:phage terminase Nu1 subunit (DNA packaging protein)
MLDLQKVGAGELAKLLGVSGARIQQLVTEGVLQRQGRGVYELGASVRAYTALLRAAAKRPEKIRAGETRYRVARASKLELELARLRGEVAPIELLEEQLTELAGMFVSQLEGMEAQLKRRVGPDLAAVVAADVKQIRDNLTANVKRHIEKLEAQAK